MKRTGNMCEYYLNLEGICFLNGSLCCNPFSAEGCDIQDRDIFHNDISRNLYKPGNKDEKLTKKQVLEAMRIVKRDSIGDWIIPYRELETTGIDIGMAIEQATKQVEDKFKKADIKMDGICVFHNVEILSGEYGVYVVGVSRNR